MNNLVIQGTLKTPFISLDPNGSFEFKGSSYPENCLSFYQPVLKWIGEYMQHPASNTNIHFYFKYFNTSTSGIVIEILNSLKNTPKPIQVTWCYDDGDEETLLSGQNFSELLEINFDYELK
jgi:predicted enzyme related to lactoylglutathione lyase